MLEIGGMPIGRLSVDDSPDELLIIDLAIMPEWRNRGIGTALLKELQARAANAGKPLRLHVEIDNPARSLYERLGFEQQPTANQLYLLMTWSPR
jgi:ribosomal protein S18 acetylase RimI-like enzyme